MNIQKFTPEEIKEILKNRLSSTNNLWSKRDVDDVEQEKVLFFKYYFDVSAAIEASLRGIVYEYCSLYPSGNAIKTFGKPQESSVAFFINYDSYYAVTNGETILKGVSQADYNNFVKFISMFTCPVIKNFTDFSIIRDIYERVRKTRNTLAHGLNAMDNNIDFSQSHLADFLYIFYITYHYYEQLYISNKELKPEKI